MDLKMENFSENWFKLSETMSDEKLLNDFSLQRDGGGDNQTTLKGILVNIRFWQMQLKHYVPASYWSLYRHNSLKISMLLKFISSW